MTRILDTRTILLLLGVNLCVLMVCMIYYFFSRRIYKGFGAWTTGISLFCLSFFLLGSRSLLPDFVSIILANAMIFSAMMLFFKGFRSFAQKEIDLRLHISFFIIVSFVLFPFLTYIKPDVNSRISLISFAIAFYFLICTRTLIREIRYDLIKLNKLLVATLISNTIFYIFRGVFFMLPQNHVETFMASGGFNSMSLLMTNVLVILYVIGLMQLNSQMLEMELHQDHMSLKENEQRYRHLVEQSSHGVAIIKDNPLRLSFISKPMADFTGYSQEEMLSFSPGELMDILHPSDREKIMETLKNRISGRGAPAVYETRIREKSGNYRWVEVFSSRVEYKRQPAVQALVVDITGRKKALQRTESLNRLNEALIDSNSMSGKLKLITDAVVDIFKADFARIWTVKPGDLCESGCIYTDVNEGIGGCRHPDRCLHLCASSGRYESINGSHRRVPFGLYKIGKIAAAEEFRFLTNNVSSDSHVHNQEWAKRLGLVSFAGYRLLSDDGGILGVLALFRKTKINSEEDAMLEHLAGTTAHVIQAAKTDESLRESEERFRAIFEQAAVGVSLNDSFTGRYVRINQKFCDIVGYSMDEMLSMTFQEITHPNDRAKDLKNMENLLSGAIRSFSMEKRYLHKRGSVVWVELTVSPMWASGETPSMHIAVIQDITEQKKIQAELQRSELNLKQAQAVAELGSWHLNISENILTWSEETYRIFEIEKKTPTTIDTFFNLVHPEDLALVGSAWQRALTGEPYSIEHRIISGKTERWVHEKAKIMFDTNNRPLEAIGTVHHITNRKTTEEKLKIFSAAVEQSPVSIVITDPDGNIEYVNPTFQNLTGYSEEEALGKNPRILQSGKTSEKTYEQLWETIVSGGKWYGEFVNKKKNGDIYWENVAISPIVDNNEKITHFLAIKEDITDRKQVENQIKSSLKEKETLLKEIHHRVKNNMQVVSSLLDLEADKITDQKALSCFADAQTKVHSIALVHEILYQAENLSMINLQSYLDNLLNHLLNVITLNNRDADIDINAGQVILKIDQAVPCGLVVTELLTNAMKYAVPVNGCLRIRINADYEGENITMTIADNGPGMPPELDIDKAQTLGLKLVTGLIEDQLEGYWRLEHGSGTCWVVTWPA